jgi:hypothetical protein
MKHGLRVRVAPDGDMPEDASRAVSASVRHAAVAVTPPAGKRDDGRGARTLDFALPHQCRAATVTIARR